MAKKRTKSPRKKQAKLSKYPKRALYIGLFIFLVLGASFYGLLLAPNTPKNTTLYIPHNATFAQVCDSLSVNQSLTNLQTFKWAAKLNKYTQKVKPGKYILQRGYSNFRILRKIANGNQDVVKLRFQNIRTSEQLAARLSQQLEPDSASLMKLFSDSDYLSGFLLDDEAFTPQTLTANFIPNTYFVYWDITPEELFERMFKEQNKFWTKERQEQAEKAGFSKLEIITLASIVEEETRKNDEKPLVASVYINRLRKNMLLQADPTVKFAVGDFSLKRIGGEHLKSESPYNTYKYQGLPPGPICIPSIGSIDAVLNYRPSNYLYFCAKEDFSGYHNFAPNYAEHMKNARLYHRALNERNIR